MIIAYENTPSGKNHIIECERANHSTQSWRQIGRDAILNTDKRQGARRAIAFPCQISKDTVMNLFPALLQAIGTLVETLQKNPIGAVAIVALAFAWALGQGLNV